MFRRHRQPEETSASPDGDTSQWHWELDGEAIAATRFSLAPRGFDPSEVGVFLNETARLMDELLLELDRLYSTYEPQHARQPRPVEPA
jgi:hypothetical protein